MRNAAAALRPAAVAQLPRPVAVAVARLVVAAVVVAGVVAVLRWWRRWRRHDPRRRWPGPGRARRWRRRTTSYRNFNRGSTVGGGGPIVGRRYHGGVWYGTGGRRFWRGQWYPYGVGPCWLLTPIGYVWVC